MVVFLTLSSSNLLPAFNSVFLFVFFFGFNDYLVFKICILKKTRASKQQLLFFEMLFHLSYLFSIVTQKVLWKKHTKLCQKYVGVSNTDKCRTNFCSLLLSWTFSKGCCIFFKFYSSCFKILLKNKYNNNQT